MAERHRLAGQARWKGMTPDERAAAAKEAGDHRRVNAELLRHIVNELAALRSEVAELRADREPVAA